MTEKVSEDSVDVFVNDELFNALAKIIDDGDYTYATIAITLIELIVSVAKSSECHEFAKSLAPLLVSTAHYLDKTGAGDEPIEESRIIRLN